MRLYAYAATEDCGDDRAAWQGAATETLDLGDVQPGARFAGSFTQLVKGKFYWRVFGVSGNVTAVSQPTVAFVKETKVIYPKAYVKMRDGTGTPGVFYDGKLTDNFDPENGVLRLSSLGKPLAESARILLTHLTDVQNTGAVFDGPEARSWLEQGATPALVRRGKAKIEMTWGPCSETNPSAQDSSLLTLHSSLRGGDGVAATVYRLAPTGARLAEIPASFDPATRRLSFIADTGYDSASATFFYEIVR